MTIETLIGRIQDAVINLIADEVTDKTTVRVNRDFGIEVFEAEAPTSKVTAMPVQHLYDFQSDEFISSGVGELAMNAFNRFN